MVGILALLNGCVILEAVVDSFGDARAEGDLQERQAFVSGIVDAVKADDAGRLYEALDRGVRRRGNSITYRDWEAAGPPDNQLAGYYRYLDSALTWLIAYDRVDTVRDVIETGRLYLPKPDHEQSRVRSASYELMHVACYAHEAGVATSFDMLNLLIESGLVFSNSDLFRMSQRGDAELLSFILDSGHLPARYDSHIRQVGRTDFAQHVFHETSNLSSDTSPILLACRAGQFENLTLLTDAGFRVRLMPYLGRGDADSDEYVFPTTPAMITEFLKGHEMDATPETLEALTVLLENTGAVFVQDGPV